jgi:hypothetical protein
MVETNERAKNTTQAVATHNVERAAASARVDSAGARFSTSATSWSVATPGHLVPAGKRSEGADSGACWAARLIFV